MALIALKEDGFGPFVSHAHRGFAPREIQAIVRALSHPEVGFDGAAGNGGDRGGGPRPPHAPVPVSDPVRPRAFAPPRATFEDPHDPAGLHAWALRVARRPDADAGRIRRRVGHPA